MEKIDRWIPKTSGAVYQSFSKRCKRPISPPHPKISSMRSDKAPFPWKESQLGKPNPFPHMFVFSSLAYRPETILGHNLALTVSPFSSMARASAYRMSSSLRNFLAVWGRLSLSLVFVWILVFEGVSLGGFFSRFEWMEMRRCKRHCNASEMIGFGTYVGVRSSLSTVKGSKYR